MSNNLDAFIPELWSKRIQILTKNSLVATQIANFEEQADLKFGDRIHRPYANDLTVNNYTKYTDTTAQDLTGTDEYLDIDQSKEISFAIDEVDQIQSKYDLENSYVERAAYRLANDIDGKVLKEVSNANVTCDGSDIGSSGAISLTTSNCLNAFMTAGAKLSGNGCEMDKTWALVVWPKTASIIGQTVIGNGLNLADLALRNGYAGDFVGYKTYVSNNVRHSNTITLDTVVATDAVTIAGVEFTFVSSLSTTAGTVAKGANDAAAAANLVAAINGDTGAGTTYVDITAADRAKLKNAGIVASASWAVITIISNGKVVASTEDTTITIGTAVEHAMLCRPGAIDLVMQKGVSVRKNPLPKQKADYFIISTLYGVKTFKEGKDRMVDIKIAA